MKRTVWPILLTFLVSACQSEAGNISALPSPEQPPPLKTELIQSPPAGTSIGLNPSPELSRPLETSTPIDSTVPAAEPEAKQTEEILPSALPTASLSAINEEVLPTREPTMTPMVTINGFYEGTYFRGLDSAPVTMIDYSDFL
jgi:hypothetical protein